jgi:uncharacterized protein
VEEIRDAAALRAVVGEVMERARTKVRPALDDLHRAWIARSPFHLVATSGADGSMDVSPRGDPPGSVLVADDHTLLLPERPGNRRVDGLLNILEQPHVGLVFLIPRRGDTLRVNGRARLLADHPAAEQMQVKGHRPTVVVEVTVQEVFFHCAKAFLRSGLWDPDSWPADDLPSVAAIAQHVSPQESLAALEQHYEPAHYETLLYRG